ncbi:hypothetical protein [Streptosporangium carneum]|uniref:Streptomyces killer toxin-like beta/gamma crystallin domain-containing protein n=1 Tax=Streptosporangium carneum TaxID=47481 RepID=A0A9W6HXH0_9ACTN|nr:hypothetical protein [Streptosporangium carneum]GLK08132.1 hypothetical protein GCM10017600_15370 [Streptosporangium carneum]
MGRIRKLGASTAAVIAITAATSLLSPALPAQAAQAANCTSGGQIGTYGGSGWATCSGIGVNQGQVIIFCEDNSGAYNTVYGPWVSSGSTSTARCSRDTVLISLGYRYR